MWSREILKARAKQVLRFSYWKAFVVSLIIAFTGGGSGGFNFSYPMNLRGKNISSIQDKDLINSFNNIFNNERTAVIAVFIAAFIIFIIILAIAFRIFVGYQFEVGGIRFFLQSARGDVNLEYITYTFNKMRYFNVIKALIWRDTFIFLWSLLFVIPGIVKSYAYSMVPYLMADNPGMDYKRAIAVSKSMTKGHKMDIFILDLSFIGWYLLGMLALLIGGLFVLPYHRATKAQLYFALSENQMERGSIG